jgi:hypothetical protein
MKKILTILAFIAVFSFVACKDDDYDPNAGNFDPYSYNYYKNLYHASFQDILGTYKSTDTIYNEYITFNSDTTYSFVVYFDTLLVNEETGKFKFNYYTYCNSNINLINDEHPRLATITTDSTLDTGGSHFIKLQ